MATGEDAYISRETTDADARATVDFRVGNATFHVQLSRIYAESPTPQQESDLEADALAVAHALASGVDGFM